MKFKKYFSVFMILAMLITNMPSFAYADLPQDTTTKAKISRTVYPEFRLSARAVGKSYVKLKWSKVKSAKRYVVLAISKRGSLKKIKSIKATKSRKFLVKKFNKFYNLKPNKDYRFVVRAYNGKKLVGYTNRVRIITGKTKGKYANTVKVLVNKSSINIESGKKIKISSKFKVYKNKKHLPTKINRYYKKYYSADKSIAKVDSKGLVTGIRSGKTTIYVCDISGKFAKSKADIAKSEDEKAFDKYKEDLLQKFKDSLNLPADQDLLDRFQKDLDDLKYRGDESLDDNKKKADDTYKDYQKEADKKHEQEASGGSNTGDKPGPSPSADSKYTYKIEHYLQSLDGETYVLDNTKTDSFKGEAGKTVSAEPKEIHGFVFDENNINNVTSDAIKADGKTVLKLYYNRITYPSLPINIPSSDASGGGTIHHEISGDGSGNSGYYYGAEILIYASADVGYEFDYWEITKGDTITTSDANPYSYIVGKDEINAIKPHYKPLSNTNYTIEYFKMGLDGKYPASASSSESKTGTTGETITATFKEIPGFTYASDNASCEPSGKIKGDGSLVLKLYYSRNLYTVNAVSASDNCGKAYIAYPSYADSSDGLYYYNRTVILSADANMGYKFTRWEISSNGDVIVRSSSPKMEYTIGTDDLTFTAYWEPKGNTPYTVNHYFQNLDRTYPDTPTSSESLYGFTNDRVDGEPKQFYGYSYTITDKTKAHGIISSDGTLELNLYYMRNLYAVNLDGGENGHITLSSLKDFDELPNKIRFERQIEFKADTPNPGYEFDHWMIDGVDDSSDASCNVERTHVVKKDVTFTAIWRPLKYTVTFNPNDGLISSDSKEVVYKSQYGDMPIPSKVGYKFGGWFTELDGGTEIFATSIVDVAENDELFAHWIPEDNTEYRIEHYIKDFNGTYKLAENGIETKFGETGASVIAEPRNITGFEYVVAESTYTGTISADGSLVLKMYYDRLLVGFHLEASGEGTAILHTEYDDVPNNKFYYGRSVHFEASANQGYKFVGWKINGVSDDSERWNTTERIITISSTDDATYTAVFAPGHDTRYRVQHLIQELTGDFVLHDTAEYVFENEGVTGETAEITSADTNVVYKGFTYDPYNERNIKSGIILADGSLKLKLYHKRNLYSLTLTSDANKGTVTLYTDYDDSVNGKFYYGRSVKFEAVPKEGYSFDTWLLNNENENTDDRLEQNRIINMSGDSEYTAVWKGNNYTVTFDTNGAGAPSIASADVTFGSQYDVMPNEPSRAGYNFKGWHTSLESETPVSEGAIVKIPRDHTIYAHWEPQDRIKYEVHHYIQELDSDEYTFKVKDIMYGTTGSTVNLNAKFKEIPGFTCNINHPSSEPSGIISGDGSLVLKLYYTRNAYSVVLDGLDHGAVSVTNPEKPDSGSNKYLYEREISLKAVASAGYEFDHWIINNANDTSVFANSAIRRYNIPSKNSIIKAVWEAQKYTVILDENGLDTQLSNSELRKEVTFDSQYGDLPIPSAEGYTFDGWYTESSDGTMVTATSIVNIPENHYLYAHWKPRNDVKYTVEHWLLNLDGETYSLAQDGIDTAYGTTGTQVEGIQRMFVGFTYDSDKTGTKTGIIKADGSLAIKIYYSRKLIPFTLGSEGSGSASLKTAYDDPATNSFYYGRSVTFEASCEPGYKFNVWKLNGISEGAGGNDNDKTKTITIPDVEELNYVATFVTGKDTIYRIEHYIETLDNNYDLYHTTWHYGETNTMAYVTCDASSGSNDLEINFPGFSNIDDNHPEHLYSGLIAGDQSLKLRVYHKRNLYKVTFSSDSNKGSVIQHTPYDDSANSEFLYERTVEINAVPLEGFTFDKWQLNGDDDESLDKNNPHRNIYIDNFGDTQEYTAVFKGNKYVVTFDTNGGSALTVASAEVTYDSPYGNIFPENPTLIGYTFDGWYTKLEGGTHVSADSSVNIASNHTLYAHWTPNENTAYNVEYYLENLKGEYINTSTDKLQGRTGSTAIARPDEIEGFTYDPGYPEGVQQGVIAPDGSLVLKLYYSRNTHLLDLDENSHGKISVIIPKTPDSLDGKYYYEREITIEATGDPYYEFVSWSDGNTDNPRTITMEDKDVSFKAIWSRYHTVTYHPNQAFGVPVSAEPIVQKVPDGIKTALIKNNFEAPRNIKTTDNPIGGKIFYVNPDTSGNGIYQFKDASGNILNEHTVSGLKDAKTYSILNLSTEFDRWTTNADGTGTSYTYNLNIAGNGYITINSNMPDNIDLYAQYKSLPISVNGVDKFYVNATNEDGSLLHDKFLQPGSPSDPHSLAWSFNKSLIGGTMPGIGYGKQNTNIIIGKPENLKEKSTKTIWQYIEKARIDKLNGCDDWFIPTESEIRKFQSFNSSELRRLSLDIYSKQYWNMFTSEENSATNCKLIKFSFNNCQFIENYAKDTNWAVALFFYFRSF